MANNPKIADTVALWKGLFKPLSLGGIALAAILGFVHYVTNGPAEVSDEDEDEDNARRLTGGRDG